MPKTKRPHQEPGERLREWLIERFGSVYKAAQELKDENGKPMVADTLYQYTMGYRLPGNKLQKRLRHVGADVEYIITGESEHRKNLKESEKLLIFRIGKAVSPEKHKLLQRVLHELSELSDKDVERLLGIWKATQK